MRILLDQGTPVPLRESLSRRQMAVADERGRSTLKNGELLDAAERAGSEAFVTTELPRNRLNDAPPQVPKAIMNDEKIKVRATESGQVLEVVVLNKRADRIEVVLGAGVHSVRCELTPTRTGAAYAGSAMGREIVYERSRAQVQADIDRLNPVQRNTRWR